MSDLLGIILGFWLGYLVIVTFDATAMRWLRKKHMERMKPVLNGAEQRFETSLRTNLSTTEMFK